MNELSAEYTKAVDLDRRIKVSAQLAQQNLYDMCMGFKEMRDSRLYKELGYSEFNDYCKTEIGFGDRQVYRMISTVENLSEDFVTSMSRIGTTKLFLLSTLSEDERTEFTESTDLESTTVRELEQEIKQLKADKDKAVAEKSAVEAEMDTKDATITAFEKQASAYRNKISQLEKEIKELESRPIDITPVENQDKKLNEVIKSLERENIRQNEELEASYRKQTNDLREKLEAKKQEELSKLRNELEATKAEYEKKLAEKLQTAVVDENKTKFKILLTSAFDAVKRLTGFIKDNNEQVYKDKTIQLLKAVEKELEG